MSSPDHLISQPGSSEMAARILQPSVVHDSQSALPISKPLKDGDLILLLTPAAIPDLTAVKNDPNALTSDPFEPLGQALAKRHPWVRHVPYLPRNGITGTHVVHIRLAKVVIFVISGPPTHGQRSQMALAEITRGVCENRPQVVVACCDISELGAIDKAFPTVVQVPGFTPPYLEAAASVLFGEPEPPKLQSPATGPNVQNLLVAPKLWSSEVWDPRRDLDAVYDLWRQCFPEHLHLNRFLFQSLLQRDGYAMHYVVREPGTSQLLGFCATYTNYADSGGERLIGSLAALLVRPSYRQRGIGLSLHNFALRQLTRTRGVSRLQLGSTFPRLFYGPPLDGGREDWFRRRDWPMLTGSGSGKEVCDWLLPFEDWRPTGFSPSTLTFRQCEFHEFDKVLQLVEGVSKDGYALGWYDQYAKFANTINIQDIVLGLNGNDIVVTAMIYIRHSGNPVEEDLPWASTIGDDVGGLTCVCIKDGINKDNIMLNLVDYSIGMLKDLGKTKLFLDAVKEGDERFETQGFRKWASYRDAWREVKKM
ncbi:hypothetical protein QBC38DRAFT_227645 [Podospora fimiseda]|uniref:N-acetyltransferase domain-containing protein n=1 Tax=Podospora fimiseda TaxID=252190 RepID=A0AAN7H1A1_9PEZI|nr:hypothetical protein QBC38DRAFT_227645 [Podospora fimiseda]